MKIGAIIQARVSSTRFPKKVLRELPYNSGITVLEQVVKRLQKSKKLNEIIIATSTEEEDKEILDLADKINITSYAGSIDNVLARYYMAAKENALDIIVRVTSDCPCIDAEVVDLIIEKHLELNSDYTSNSIERTFPHGLDTEVFNFEVLEKAFNEADKTFEKEHVTPYIYKTHPEIFKINKIIAPQELNAPDIRITLDTKEDYALLCAVYDFLYYENEYFFTAELIKLFKEKPWLKYINLNIIQKKVFDNLQDEMNEAIKLLDLQDLNRVKEYLESKII